MRIFPSAPSLGVDLLEFERVKSFYKAHQDSLDSVLDAAEVAYIRRGARPVERLARLLAAKEAVYKTLGGAAGGVAGFLDVRVVSPGSRKIYFRGLKIQFHKNKKFLVADAHRQKKA